ncbi:MAG: hypothetical protein ACREF5_01305 [Candidatus Saccharimonadales bacterium]
MDSAEQQVVNRLKEARNILVTVRNDPTVDLLSALIGLTLGLDKMDKHVAAVFSGEVPSAIEFLKPQETIEQSPDSLRDFIIALDKSKADKLRYKVEDKVVRIFITPYKTSLSQDDLEFSQGDFNVDAVVALGAHEQQELDQAITTHGRILHDATVMSINDTSNGNLGSVNWQDTTASSISELVTKLLKDLSKTVLDEQIATALLTGIVAETDRFSNEKTTPRTMSLAGDLMSAGANQQLVASELDEESSQGPSEKSGSDNSSLLASLRKPNKEPSKTDDGTLDINHAQFGESKLPDAPPFQPDNPTPGVTDENGLPELPFNRDMLPLPEPPKDIGISGVPQDESPFADAEIKTSNNDIELPSVGRSYLVDETTPPSDVPPAPNPAEPQNSNPFDVPPAEPSESLLKRDSDNHTEAPVPPTNPVQAPQPLLFEPSKPSPPIPAFQPNSSTETETLEEIEESVHSSHLDQQAEQTNVDAARHEVLKALETGPEPIKPINSLNARPLGDDLHPSERLNADQSTTPKEVEIDKEGNLKPKGELPAVGPSVDSTPQESQPLDMPLPPINSTGKPVVLPDMSDPFAASPHSPPPVPPPFMPPNYTSPGQ